MSEQRENADRPDRGPFPVSSSASSLFRRLQPERTPPDAVEVGAPDSDEAASSTPAEELPHVSPFTTNNLAAGNVPIGASANTRPAPATPNEALRRLDEKMERAGHELTNGTITRSQYQAIQSYYAERKALIQRLIERSPDTDAWLRAAIASEGYGHLLLQQDEATVDGLALFDNWTGNEIRALGFFDMPPQVIGPLLDELGPVDGSSQPPGAPYARQLDDGRWLSTVRGTFTTAVAVFSARPSSVQLGWQSKLHQDFEHDNQPVLEAGYPDPRALTYPQQALFPFD